MDRRIDGRRGLPSTVLHGLPPKGRRTHEGMVQGVLIPDLVQNWTWKPALEKVIDLLQTRSQLARQRVTTINGISFTLNDLPITSCCPFCCYVPIF
jgi:hypothetical protein